MFLRCCILEIGYCCKYRILQEDSHANVGVFVLENLGKICGSATKVLDRLKSTSERSDDEHAGK